MDIISLVKSNIKKTYDLHSKFVNPQFVKVLETICFNRNYTNAKDVYLFDKDGNKVLDFLAGFGVFNIGRNHPVVAKALHEIIDYNPASIVQMDLGCLSGVLAEKLAEITPKNLEAVFFTNSGTEGVEAALKIARQASKKSKVIYCKGAFHGLTLGSLSACGAKEFRDRNEPLLPNCICVPFNDINALEKEFKKKDVAAFIVEPIQGKGVFIPDDEYFSLVRKLCDKYKVILIADEVQTGLGRTGEMFAINHWDIAPDMMVISKALSGGYIPIGAIITTRKIHGKVFDCMERCFAHSNTFGQNDFAMTSGLAALSVIEDEKLIENSKIIGKYLLDELEKLTDKYEFLSEIRGKGLMIGIQFGKPKSLSLKTNWMLLHKMNPDLFCQMITMPLLKKHNILTQVAGHGLDTVKILPPLTINKENADYFIKALDDVLGDIHRFPGPAWTEITKMGIRTAKS